MAFTDSEKDTIFACLLASTSTCLNDLPLKYGKFALTEAQERLSLLLIQDGKVISPIVAAHMASKAREILLLAITDMLAYAIDPHVNSSVTGLRWPFSHRNPIHLLECWARLPEMSFAAFLSRLKLLVRLGIDIHNFRSKNGGNLIHLVADTLPRECLYGLVIKKITILAEEGLDFHHPNDAGETALARVRRQFNFICRSRSINVYRSSVFTTLKSLDEMKNLSDWVPPNPDTEASDHIMENFGELLNRIEDDG